MVIPFLNELFHENCLNIFIIKSMYSEMNGYVGIWILNPFYNNEEFEGITLFMKKVRETLVVFWQLVLALFITT